MKKHNDTTAHTSNNTTPANRLAAMKRPMLGFAAALAATGSISAIGSWVLHSNRAATAAMTEQPLVTAEPIAAQGAPHISTMELSDALIEAVMGAGCAGDTCQIGKLPPYEEVCCADGGYPPECDDDCGWALPAPGLTEETWETLIEDCDSGYCPSGWQIGIPPPINKPPPPQTGGGGGGGGSKPEPDLTLLGLGTVSEAAIDASIPGVTFPAEFGRTYNSKRITEGESTSQGIKWRGGIIEMFLKEQGSDILVMVDAATSRLMDWNGSSFDPPVDFKGTFEKSGSGASETYTLTSLESGEVYKFYSINSAIPSAWAGRLKERTDVYGTESITYDYSNAGQVESATTSQGWAVEFTYDATHERRTQIELKDGSGTVIQEVSYTYYEDVSGTKTHLGSNGDLVAVEVKFRTSDVSDWIVQNTHYRYYRSGDSDGEPHQMKAVFDAAAIETINSVGDSSVDTPSEILNKADDYTVSGGNDIIEYATRAYTYYTSDLNTGSSVSTPWGSQNLQTKYGGVNLDESGSVKTMVTMGACATCGDSGQIGVGQKSTFFYIRLNATPSSNNDVAMLVIEDLEDSSGNEVSRQISGVNEQQHRLRYIVIEDPTDTTPDVWCRSERIDSDQRVTERRSPSAHTLVNTDAEVEDFLDPEDGSNDTNTLNSSTGEIISYEYNSDHYVTGTRLKKGRTGTSYFVSATDWGNGTNDKPKHFRTATYEYFTKTTTRTAGEKTSFAYQFHDAGDTRLKRTETTFPIVSSGQNGSGVATTTYDYYDSSGRKRWEKDGEGYVTYIAQHPDVGGESYRMIDVDTASLNSEITSGSSGKWIAWSGSVPTGLTRDAGLDSALEITGKTEFDDLGRKSKEIGASGAEHYMVYDTNQTMRFRYWDTVSDEPAYAISVEETDDGGRVIEQYSVKPSRAANTSSVPTGLLAGTTQAHYVTWVKLNYDDEGVLESQDRYHDIPSSGNGTLSSNFYRTINQYDEMGRVEYTVEIGGDACSLDSGRRTHFQWLEWRRRLGGARPDCVRAGPPTVRQNLDVMPQHPITLRTANPILEEGLVFARYLDEAAEGFFHLLLGRAAAETIARAFTETDNAYSFENVVFAERDGAVVGMVSGYTVEQYRRFSDRPLTRAAGRRALRLMAMSMLLAPILRVLDTLGEGEFYIQALAVDHEARGRGVGSALIDRIEQRAVASGSARLALDVSGSNEGARRLYERRGMTVESEWPKRIAIPGVRILRMTKAL